MKTVCFRFSQRITVTGHHICTVRRAYSTTLKQDIKQTILFTLFLTWHVELCGDRTTMVTVYAQFGLQATAATTRSEPKAPSAQ